MGCAGRGSSVVVLHLQVPPITGGEGITTYRAKPDRLHELAAGDVPARKILCGGSALLAGISRSCWDHERRRFKKADVENVDYWHAGEENGEAVASRHPIMLSTESV